MAAMPWESKTINRIVFRRPAISSTSVGPKYRLSPRQAVPLSPSVTCLRRGFELAGRQPQEPTFFTPGLQGLVHFMRHRKARCLPLTARGCSTRAEGGSATKGAMFQEGVLEDRGAHDPLT